MNCICRPIGRRRICISKSLESGLSLMAADRPAFTLNNLTPAPLSVKYRKIFRCAPTFLICIVISSCSLSRNITQSSTGEVSKLDSAKDSEIREVLREMMSTHDIPGASIAIALNGEIVFADGFGFSDLENRIAAKASTVYRSASIGKSITATAIMRLVENNVISLSDPVQRHCPRFPEKPEGRITVRHLLAHQSGIRHYGGPNDYAEQNNVVHYDDVDDALAIFENDPLLHAPGDAYTYSTFGYNVLGCVLQGASGGIFMDKIVELVLKPAGMEDTRDDDPRALIPNRAAGYVMEGGRLLNAVAVDMSSKLPAGGYVTTVVDLARFAIAFQGGRLVSLISKDQMLSNQILNDGTSTTYGLGWGLSDPNDLWYGYREAFHGGSTPGVSGMLYMITDRQFAVALLSNQQSFKDRMTYVATISKIVLDLDK